MVSAREETEQRLRGEMEREKDLARGAEGSALALSQRLDNVVIEASEKATAAADLRARLDEVQVRGGVVIHKSIVKLVSAACFCGLRSVAFCWNGAVWQDEWRWLHAG